jgi:Zn-dependent metalloprotease
MNRKPNFAGKLISVLVGLTLILSATQPVNVNASAPTAQGDGIRRSVHPQTGKLTFLGADPANPIRVSAAMGYGLAPEARGGSILDVYGPEFGITNPPRELSVMKTNNAEGRLMVRYQQVYNKIPVMGGELIVNMKEDGSLLSINGEVSPDLKIDVLPRVNAQKAKQAALTAIAKSYNLKATDLTVTEPELWIYDARLLNGNDLTPVHLVWRMDVTSTTAPVRELVLVNAKSGDVTLHFNQIDTTWRGNDSSIPAMNFAPATIKPARMSRNNSVPQPLGASGYTIFNAPTPGSDLFVAPSPIGNDANDCLFPATPCATINAAIGKATANQTIYIAKGTYTGSGAEVVRIDRSINLSGGWDLSFSAQTNHSIINGEFYRRGVAFDTEGVTTNAVISRFIIMNGKVLWGSGGGVFTGCSCDSLTLQDSAVVNNVAHSSSGIYTGGNLNLYNVTVSNNHATDIVGGISTGVYEYNVSRFENSTISNNTAGRWIAGVSGNNTMKNSILSDNTTNGVSANCGWFVSDGNNIIDDMTGCSSVAPISGDQFGVDPNLNVLIPDKGYRPLLIGSPAINAGNACIVTDQRGIIRDAACDIGAYEYTSPGAPSSLAITDGNDQHTPPNSSFAKLLQVAVLDSVGSPIEEPSGINILLAAPDSGAGGIFSDSGTNTTTISPNSAGIATASMFSANNEFGAYPVMATSAGLESVNFSLENSGLYVAPAPTGNDGNSCKNPVSPCATINHAIELSDYGDTILVADGFYAENVLIDRSVRLSGGWNPTFSSQVGYSIIDGENYWRPITIYGSFDTEIARFILQNGRVQGVSGAGLATGSGNTTITNVIIRNNHSLSGTGGIENGGTLVINNSAIVNNISDYGGGGINNNGTLTIINSTISGNKAMNGGGGGISTYNSSIHLNNATITDNYANVGGGIYNNGSNVNIENTILAENTAATSGQDCSGSITSDGHNILGDVADCSITASVGDQFNQDPKIGPFIETLGFNTISASSPAKNAGNAATCTLFDQRGVERFASDVFCDIGAIEIMQPGHPTYLLVSSGSGQYAFPNSNFKKPLKALVVDSDGDPVPGQTIVFTAPSSGSSGSFTGANPVFVVTDDLGVATTPIFKANNQFGGYNVTATLADLHVDFSLGNGGWFLSPAGLDGNDCRFPSTACRTIQTVVDKALPSETVYVAEGTYSDSASQVVYLTKNIILLGGWDPAFLSQIGYSTVNGEDVRAGVLVDSNVTATMTRFIIEHASYDAYSRAGVSNAGYLTLENCELRNNHMTLGPGGGIQNSGTLEMRNSHIHHNVARDGGGIYNIGTMTLSNTVINDNVATSNGGGISNDWGTFTGTAYIYSSKIFGNESFWGGGIYNHGTLLLSQSSVSGNYAANGGGLFGDGISSFNGGNTTVEDSTLSDNKTGGPGGGIYLVGGTISLNNVTVSGNLASSGGGIYRQPDGSGSVEFKNSIISDNRVTRGTGPDCSGPSLTSSGNNLIGNTAGCSLLAVTGDLFNVNPQFGAFLPAQGYHPLLAGSPAINAGNTATCKPTDQRDQPRNGGCDMGAYEYMPAGAVSTLSVEAGYDQHNLPGEAYRLPLQAAALDSKGTPVSGVPITFIVPSSGAGGVFDGGGATVTVSTNSFGIASVALIANHQRGAFQVAISALGAVASDAFLETNMNWFISPTGNDVNDCTNAATPCASIDGVISKTGFYHFDTIWMAQGAYDVPATRGIEIRKSVSILGGWDAGFTVQNGSATLADGVYIGALAHHYLPLEVLLDRLVIKDTNTMGLYNRGILKVTNSAIVNNTAGIENNGELTIINSTISGNRSHPYSNVGGIFQGDSSLFSTTVINSTVTNNDSNLAGGIVNNGPGRFVLVNSIVIANTNPFETLPTDCYGKITSGGHNVIGNIGRQDILGICTGNWANGDMIGTYTVPLATSRVINPTLTLDPASGQWYHALPLGSLAIDHGNQMLPGADTSHACPATDQLNIVRPQGQYCDIGAVEAVFTAAPPLLVTYSASNSTLLPGTQVCFGNTGTCAGGDSHSQGAQANAYATYQKYLEWYGRNSIDGNGMQINSSVHYGSGYQNAYWNGHMMIFGDGYGFPLADDVVAHELTHGVTQSESNLFYWYQSGAINESFSDLWGEAVDQANISSSDLPSVMWLLGEDVTGLGAVRNMQNPPAFHQPDSMSNNKYCKSGPCLTSDNGGVHINSGVNNKAAYLMVAGGTFNSKTVTALGWSKVLPIYYEAQTNLLTSGSDYLDLYNVLNQACLNKIGTTGIVIADCQEVRDATDAVKMNAQPATGFNPDVDYCPAGTSKYLDLYVEDFETGTDGWTFAALSGESAWGPASGNASSGERMLWADDGYANTDSIVTMSNGVALPASSKPFLHFAHAYNFDAAFTSYYDGGVLEYSINNGTIWIDAKSLFSSGQNYRGPLKSGTGNLLASRFAFAGDSHGYVDSRYKLETLAGQTIRFRWRMGTDQSYSVLGWYVDDVRIYTCVGIPKAPTLSAPASNALVTDYTPTFDWSDSTPVSDLHHYELQLATDSAFTVGVVNINNILTSTYTPLADLASNTKFYWRVRAVNAAGGSSAWTASRYFRTALLPPNSLTPGNVVPGAADSIHARRPTLTWEAVPGATGYTVEASTTLAFSSKAINKTLSTTTYTHTSDIAANTVFYWRVKATGTNGPSAYSQVRTFTTGNPPSVPTLSAPMNNALVTTRRPLFDWRDATLPNLTFFDHYEIQLATNSSFTGATSFQTTLGDITDSDYTPLVDLLSGTTYYWRVRSWNAAGDFSGWSSVRTVRIP